MMHLRVRRSVFVDHFRNNIARTFCSKPPGEENSPPPTQSKNKAESKTLNDEVTNKINDILKSMIEHKSTVQDEATVKAQMPVPDYGFKSKKRPKIEDHVQRAERAMREAAADVAKALGNDPEIEKQLLTKALDGPMTITNLDWNQLISGMEIDNTKNVEEYVNKSTRSEQVQKSFAYKNIDPTADIRKAIRQSSAQSMRFKMKSVNLLGDQPLGIFTKDFNGTKGTELKMWKDLEEYELKVAVSHPPRNYFEKMIQWTKQGKVWKFPIDNEQGMEEEKKVHFTEHIFLEGYLEDWCPKRGPVRHFMELVCVGMSKNPYMPVKDKREHIIWFKNYFESKKDLLMQVGAYGENVESSTTTTS